VGSDDSRGILDLSRSDSGEGVEKMMGTEDGWSV